MRLKKIEEVYNTEFQEELKNLYNIAVPVSKGFCNQRNFDDKNVKFIKEVIERPIKYIYELAFEAIFYKK